MSIKIRFFALFFVVAALVGLSACGSDSESTSAAASATDPSDDGDGDGDGDQDKSEHDGDADHDEDDDHDEADHDDADPDDHDDGSTSGLGAHEHGAAELSVAWSDGEVIVDLVSPTYNIFGFEYEPTTDEELALVADRTEALSTAGVIAINAEAGCDLAEDVLTELEYDGSHAELTASWWFSCEQPDEIKQLDAAALFAEFPDIEDIDAQWASASGQSAAELSPSATVLALE